MNAWALVTLNYYFQTKKIHEMIHWPQEAHAKPLLFSLCLGKSFFMLYIMSLEVVNETNGKVI